MSSGLRSPERHLSSARRLRQADCEHRQSAPIGRPLAYDLFAGLGGASLGLRRAGYDVVGFERGRAECASQAEAGRKVVQGDVDEIDWMAHPQPDVIWASPPCQPYSVSGKRRGVHDRRDGLGATIRAVGAVGPRLVMVENVPGLAHARHRPALRHLMRTLTELDYVVEARILNCADFGVPQVRRRLFLVARSDGQPIRWPEPTHDARGRGGRHPWVTMASALGVASMSQFRPRWPNDDDLSWPFERPAPTIVASFRPDVVARPAYRGRGAEPRQDARGSVIVTVEDALRLQGLPANLPLCGSESLRRRQIGNAVPPVVVSALVSANHAHTPVAAGSERDASHFAEGEGRA